MREPGRVRPAVFCLQLRSSVQAGFAGTGRASDYQPSSLLLLWLLGALLLSGCLAKKPAPAPPTPPPQVQQPAPPPPPPRRDPVADLLYLADVAIKDNRLTTPAGRNAHEYLQRVLNLDPDNPEVKRGLERIVEGYLSLAERSLERGNEGGARNFLRLARRIDAQHPGIAAVQAQIDQLAKTDVQILPLDSQALTDKTPAVQAQLKQIGTMAKAQRAFVFINARNDAEGRWIYQQLAQAPGTSRVRGQIVLNGTPGIEMRTEKKACVAPC